MKPKRGQRNTRGETGRMQTIVNMVLITGALTTTMAFLPGCRERGKNPVDSELTENAGSFAGFIGGVAPEGWALAESVLMFTADNLYERIDGRAELYHSYDVVSLTTATFDRDGDIGDFIELSVYDMGNPANGFGIFSVERYPGEQALDLGRLSYRSDANVYVWKGRFYVVVVTSNLTEELGGLSREIARKVTSALPDSGEPVWGLSAFPEENLIRDSIQYYNTDALGLDFMAKTFTAKYSHGEGEITALLSRKDSEEDAAEILKLFAGYGEKYGRGFEELAVNGTPAVLCDLKGTFDLVFHKGRFVGGIISANNPGTALTFALKLAESLE